MTYNEANNTLSFTPTALLTSNTTYTGTVKSTVKDLTGNYLQTDYIWTFSTGIFLSPTVIIVDPADGATGVLLDKTVTATFSVPMDPLTITATTFTLKQGTTPIAGTVSYTGSTASFDPTAALTPNTVYTATVTKGAKNVAGTPLQGDYIWTFTTAPYPTVISTDPVNLATGVLLNKTVTATFSEPMNPLTINATTFTLKQGATIIAGTVSFTGSTASFNPTSTLAASTIYTATITTGAESVTGIKLQNNYVWTFTTGVLVSPIVISTDPLNNATGVILNKTVTATFSVPMDPTTITSTSFTVKQGTTAVAGTVSYAGTTAYFVPSGLLTANTVYTCTITTAAKNVAGTPLQNDYIWTFTTGAFVPPLVISTIPANNATGVLPGVTVSATFNMPMNPLTINNATFTLFEGANPVAGLVTYSGTTASFDPISDLLENTLFTATITTGATNLAGDPLANNYVWSFTTQNVPPPPPVDLGTAENYGAFGGNAGVTNQGVNTVVNGSIGSTAASTLVTGFHDGLTGDVYTETPLNVGLVTDGIFTAPPPPGTAVSEAIATQALLDATAAYLSISPASLPGGTDPGAGELGGLVLAPGIYMAASGTFNISNDLTLDGQGDPNAFWVFQTAAGLTVGLTGTGGARSVLLVNGAQTKNVFWYVGSAATINGAGGGVMEGTIIANSGVTFSTPGNLVQTTLNGRAISLISSVTMVNTTINVPAP